MIVVERIIQELEKGEVGVGVYWEKGEGFLWGFIFGGRGCGGYSAVKKKRD